MKVALLGATGFVGSALLKEALGRGYMVTAIVRHPESSRKTRGAHCEGLRRSRHHFSCDAAPGERCNYQRFQSWMEKSESLWRSGSGNSVHYRRREDCGHQTSPVGGCRGRVAGQARSPRYRQPGYTPLGEARFFSDDQCSGPIAERTRA